MGKETLDEKDYQAEYYLKNKERLQAYKHAYYLEHKAEYVERTKRFNLRRKAQLKKLEKSA